VAIHNYWQAVHGNVGILAVSVADFAKFRDRASIRGDAIPGEFGRYMPRSVVRRSAIARSQAETESDGRFNKEHRLGGGH
jgi:hypothetical protein